MEAVNLLYISASESKNARKGIKTLLAGAGLFDCLQRQNQKMPARALRPKPTSRPAEPKSGVRIKKCPQGH